MASAVDICNLALSHLGDEALVTALDPSDGSAQADQCVTFYPIARDTLLSLHAWAFATRRVALGALTTSERPGNWAYAYSVPSDLIEPIAVLDTIAQTTPMLTSFPPSDFVDRPANNDDTQHEYTIETLTDGSKVIFTNVYQATLRYIRTTTDTAKFSPLFVVACARLLAAYLAGPIIKGSVGMKVSADQMKIFLQVEFPMAAAMDAKAQRRNLYRDFMPSGLAARR